MTALILAAGLGTRLRPLTDHLPKPTIPFLGLPIGLFAVEYAISMGATKFILNTHHLPEILEASLRPFLKTADLNFEFVHEPKILGSGGGLKNIEDRVTGDSVILINGDEIVLPENTLCFSELVSQHESSGAIASLLCMEHRQAGKEFGGVWVDSEKKILGFGKSHVSGSKQTLHFTGLSIYSKDVLRYLPEKVESNILYDGLVCATKKGMTANAISQDLTWFETGNPPGLYQAQVKILSCWNKKRNDILKSAINRFADSRLKDSILKSQEELKYIGTPVSSPVKTWLINSSLHSELNEIPEIDRRIIMPSYQAKSLRSIGKIYY